MDYFVYEATPEPTPATSVTLAALVTETYARTELSESTAYFDKTQMKAYFNEGIRTLENLRADPSKRFSQLNFNKAKDTAALTYASNQINVGAIDAYVPGTGMVVLGDSAFVTYTGTTPTSLTGVSGLDHVYLPGDRVRIGYELPSTVKKVVEVQLDGKRMTPIDYRMAGTDKDGDVNYFIRGGFLFVPYSMAQNSVITVSYQKFMPAFVDDTDYFPMDNEYRHIISLYALWNLFADKEDTRFQLTRQRYDEKLREYKAWLRQYFSLDAKLQYVGPLNRF